MKQEKILESLKDLGLKKAEAKLYFYLSKRGPKQANQIIKALKMKKQQLYPLIKNLQNKAIIESSLDRPAKFSAVSFEKVLDLFAKTKMEEAKIIQENKGKLLSDWQSINLQYPIGKSVNFTIIKGKKYVYSKIQQMIQETKNQFSVISNLSDLIRSEQFGVLDTIQSHPKKSNIQFRIITEVPKQHLQATKQLLENINPRIELKGRNTDLGSSIVPRMAIKDHKEILYFISQQTGELEKQNEYNSLFTNCTSIVRPLSNVFEDLWQNSTEIKQKIREIETGILPRRTLIIADANKAETKYNQVLRKAKKEILIVTSSDRLSDFQKTIPKIKDLTSNNLSIKIMSPIIKENLDVANKLSNHFQVRHIPQGYLDTMIVDNNHLFQFNNSTSVIEGIETNQNFKNTFYTSNPEHIIKAKNMLENIWRNSSDLSHVPLESVFNPIESFSLPPKSASNDPSSEAIFDYLKSKPVISKTLPGEIKEKEVVAKIINLNQISSPGKVVKCYCKIGYAAINPPSNFNVPKMLITTTQIDKKSSFGAEDRVVFHLWQETNDGFKYVPVAIIGDNPNFPIGLLKKGQYGNTPAEKNFRLVNRQDIQFQLYGNTFLASWMVPITLVPNKVTLPPGTIILEAYGEVKSKHVILQYPFGAKYDISYNGFDSFVTFMHESSKYTGPGTDGLFLRDTFIEIFFP